ncbi:MAG: hypothetical protein ACRD4R_15950, partial [Candidatus Acidiferrales bacterium]
YQARCPIVAGSREFATIGVRTFLPFAPFARGKPAITRLTRWGQLYRESPIPFAAGECLDGYLCIGR